MNRHTSVLTHPLPYAVTVDGVSVPIRTDYRTGILFGELAKDDTLDDLSRIKLGLWLYCGDDLPAVDPHKLFAAILAFYRGDAAGRRNIRFRLGRGSDLRRVFAGIPHRPDGMYPALVEVSRSAYRPSAGLRIYENRGTALYGSE